ncbi:hypothetical protein SDC9_136352 [bioreactor metagenome]|uniref:Uncharacterized protein n=1 Tax=bioreactor metagenome TaxID=1076179 RepID=A0A645DIC1_9ZZZZ
MGAFEEADRGDGVEHPHQFGDFRHVGLPEKDRVLGIEPAGQKIQRDMMDPFAQRGGFGIGGQRMVIGDEQKAFPEFLELEIGPHRAEIVADMQCS